MVVLLDCTVLINYLRGRPAVARVRGLRDRGDVPYTTAVNVEEITRRLQPSEAAPAWQLFDGLRIVPLRRSEGQMAGAWRRRFSSRGTTVSQADCLIAAAAHSVAARLVTGTPRHFPMREADVEHWRVGA